MPLGFAGVVELWVRVSFSLAVTEEPAGRAPIRKQLLQTVGAVDAPVQLGERDIVNEFTVDLNEPLSNRHRPAVLLANQTAEKLHDLSMPARCRRDSRAARQGALRPDGGALHRMPPLTDLDPVGQEPVPQMGLEPSNL